METLKNTLLVPVGDLHTDLAVIKKAVEISRNSGGDLHFLHVKQDDVIMTGGYAYMEMTVVEDWNENELQNLLDEHAEGLSTKIEIIPHGDIVDSIADRAKNYQMLIIGHHHAGLVEEFLFSSKSAKVLNRVNCDVYIAQT